MKTYLDLLERLKQEDEVSLIEILDLSTTELVDALESYIFDKQDKIWDYYNETNEEFDWEEVAYKS